MVTVLLHGKPAVLPDPTFRAGSLIEAFNPGMRGGQAIAELVLGLIEPTGRLPISVPRHVGQQPVYYNQIRGQHGDRYADLTQEPLFAFGHGLSYTTVTYSDLSIANATIPSEGVVHGEVTVTNVGARPTLETVQCYVRDVVTSDTWADIELKNWQQVPLAPGQSRTVSLSVPAAACSLVDADGLRALEPGDFELLVGPSSRPRDLLMAPFAITPAPRIGVDA